MEGFTDLDIRLEGDGAFEEFREAFLHGAAQGGKLFRIAALPGGMKSGNLSIAIGICGDDGKVIIGETSWRLLHAAVRSIEARYGRPE